MVIWTDDQINAVLAELGLRKPGENPPENPERIVASELLTVRQQLSDLIKELIETNTRYERVVAERDRLAPIETERDDLKRQLSEALKAVDLMGENVRSTNAQRDAAFAMVRDLEVQLRQCTSGGS